MKKLFLAVSICASLFASNAVWAAEIAEKSESAVPSQSKIAEAAALNWAGDLAHDMQLSADPLARAMAEITLQLLATNLDPVASPFRLSQDQKAAIFSKKTPVPVKILYLQAACSGYTPDAVCGDINVADALARDDTKNAFTVLLAESLRASAAIAALDDAQSVAATKKTNTEYRDLVKAQGALNGARVLRALSFTSEYYDYAQAFKAPILLAVKRRPPPPEVLANLPIEVVGLAAAFAPEEIAAEIFANALVTSAEASYRQINPCAIPDNIELKAQCARVAELVLANPKNSAASAGFALSRNQEHPYATRINAFNGIANQKDVDPTILLSLDWLALRSVLNKAATQGDVAAIPDALAWAELAYAKIPDKSADVIAAEAKVRAEREASWKAEAAAAQAVSEAQHAAAFDPEFDAVPAPAKTGSGCSANAETKVDPTAIEFKN